MSQYTELVHESPHSIILNVLAKVKKRLAKKTRKKPYLNRYKVSNILNKLIIWYLYFMKWVHMGPNESYCVHIGPNS